MNKFPSSPTEYELIVKEIYQDLLSKEGILAEVRHNVTDMPGKSETYPQLDIYWRFKVAGLEHKVVVDCKNYSKKVAVEDIRNLAFVVADIGATKGVMVTTIGYQKGAEKVAEKHSIDLKLVRSPKDIDWSGYIKVIQLNICAFSRELTSYNVTCSVSHDPYLKELYEKKELIFTQTSTETPVYYKNGSLHSPSLHHFFQNSCLSYEGNDGDECSFEIVPENIYFQASTTRGEKLLIPIVNLSGSYKLNKTTSESKITAEETIKAVLQDHTSGEIEYNLPKIKSIT